MCVEHILLVLIFGVGCVVTIRFTFIFDRSVYKISPGSLGNSQLLVEVVFYFDPG